MSTPPLKNLLLLGGDIIVNVLNFLPVQQVSQLCGLSKAFKQIILSSEEYWLEHLSRLNLFHDSSDAPKIRYAAKRPFFVYQKIQNWSAHQMFLSLVTTYGRWRGDREGILKELEVRKSDSVRTIRAGCQPPTRPIASVSRPANNNFSNIAFHGFKQHPDSKPNKLTVDFLAPVLANSAKVLLSHLCSKDTSELFLNNDDACKGTISRYHRFMMLQARHPGLLFVPTSDIANAWHSHMLRPSLYHKYCEDLIAKYGQGSLKLHKERNMIIHCNAFAVSDLQKAVYHEAFVQTVKLWDQYYQESYLPEQSVKTLCEGAAVYHEKPFFKSLAGRSSYQLGFSLTRYNDLSVMVPVADDNDFLKSYAKAKQQTVTYLINYGAQHFADCSNQVNIITVNQVMADSQFSDKLSNAVGEQRYRRILESDIKAWVKLYERYLYFLTKHPNAAPTYPIDLIWHAHMCNPIAYVKDTIHLLGYPLDHDPTYQPTEQDSQITNDNWNAEFAVKLQDEHTFTIPNNM